MANPAAARLGAVAPHAIGPADAAASADTPVRLTETADGLVLANGLVSVTVSRDGLVTSAIDLATGRDAIAPGREANLLHCLLYTSDAADEL